MRRFVLSIAVMSALSLGACSGGGSVLNFASNQQPDRVIVTTQSPSNVARVLQGGAIGLSATAVRGSQNGTGLGNTFRWSAALVTSGNYTINADGQTRPCAAVNLTQLAGPLAGVPVPYAADFGVYIAIDPVNEANIILFPPIVIPNPTPLSATLQTNTPYCVVVNAEAGTISGSGVSTHFNPSGAVGSITVAVVNPNNPLQ